jgi:hypothetical protein
VLSRLCREPVLRLEHVTVGRPRVGGTPRNLPVAEVARGGAAVLHRELELLGGFLVQLRRSLQPLTGIAQFQTLTSR